MKIIELLLFSQTLSFGKLSLVKKSRGPLLARPPLTWLKKIFCSFFIMHASYYLSHGLDNKNDTKYKLRLSKRSWSQTLGKITRNGNAFNFDGNRIAARVKVNQIHTKQWTENWQLARENTPKPGETQEFMENISFLEWPANFYVLFEINK